MDEHEVARATELLLQLGRLPELRTAFEEHLLESKDQQELYEEKIPAIIRVPPPPSTNQSLKKTDVETTGTYYTYLRPLC